MAMGGLVAKAKWQLIVAVVLGLLATLLVYAYVQKAKEAAVKGWILVDVIVASRDIPAGTAIDLGMLAKRRVPKQFLSEGVVVPQERDQLVGQRINTPLKRGDLLRWVDIGERGAARAGLSERIKEGDRAMSIPVDIISSVSGYIRPNDHVDILGSFMIPPSTKTGVPEKIVMTILQNVTVIETGDRISQMARAATGTASINTLTLLVAPEEAEMLVMAQETGRLTTILRNPKDVKTRTDIPKIRFEDVAQIERRVQVQNQRNERIGIEIIRGGK